MNELPVRDTTMKRIFILLALTASAANAQYNVQTISGVTSAYTNSIIQHYPRANSGYRGPFSNHGSVELATVPVPSIYDVTSTVAPNTSLATHTVLFIRNPNGTTERVIEGKAERLINGSESHFGFGRLIARIGATKAELGPTVAPQLQRLDNPYGESPAGFQMFKNKILSAFAQFHFRSQTQLAVGYYPIPEQKPGSGNSNSLIGSILRRSGVYLPVPVPSAYGWDVDVIQ